VRLLCCACLRVSTRPRVLLRVVRDKVMTRNVATGTHKGSLMGIEPRNKRAQWTGISIDRIEQGKIVGDWVSWDMMGMLQQLGVVSMASQEGR
jgi:predicted ester cyclase